MPIVVNGMRRRAIKHRYSSKSLNYLPKNLQKKIAFIQEKKKNIIENMIKNKAKITINSLSQDQMTTISSLSGVQEFPMRVKCATMAWHTCLSAVEKK